MPDDEIDQITWENSCRFFGYDPFGRISREKRDGRRLRALLTDVDTSTRPAREWRERYEAADAG